MKILRINGDVTAKLVTDSLVTPRAFRIADLPRNPEDKETAKGMTEYHL